MHYELNVSKDGQHVFATHPRSVTTEREAARLYVLFTQAFPEADGFKTDCTKYQDSGTSVNPTHFPVAFREEVWVKHHEEHLANANDGRRLMSSEKRAEQWRAQNKLRAREVTLANGTVVRTTQGEEP